MTRKIVLEEHFVTAALAAYGGDIESMIDPECFANYKRRLPDFENFRLEEMDKYGIDVSVLSATTPGVQIEPDAATATRLAAETNDVLAKQIQKHPTRFAGFAHLALQNPHTAADELERAVTQLGLKGALINGHTNGEYLDADKFSPVWERAQALGVPIYLHPANSPNVPASIVGYPEMAGPAWAWGPETAGHALRLIYGGVFDRYPASTLILGHMGETLPFFMWRLDSRYAMLRHQRKLNKKPSDYIRENIMITTAGAFDIPALLCSVMALGAERIMFSVDYPYEETSLAVQFLETAPLSVPDRARIAGGNAARLLKI